MPSGHSEFLALFTQPSKKGARSLAGVLNPTKKKQCLIKQWAVDDYKG